MAGVVGVHLASEREPVAALLPEQRRVKATVDSLRCCVHSPLAAPAASLCPWDPLAPGNSARAGPARRCRMCRRTSSSLPLSFRVGSLVRGRRKRTHPNLENLKRSDR